MKTAQVKWLGEEPNNHREGYIELHGTGSLALDDQGVHLRGKKVKKLVPILAASIVGLVSLIAVIILVDSLGVRILGTRGGSKLAFIVGMIGGVLPGYYLYTLLMAKMPGLPVEQRIAWAQLKVVRATAERIEVKSSEPGFTGHVMFRAADPQSQAVLAEAFGLPQTLDS